MKEDKILRKNMEDHYLTILRFRPELNQRL